MHMGFALWNLILMKKMRLIVITAAQKTTTVKEKDEKKTARGRILQSETLMQAEGEDKNITEVEGHNQTTKEGMSEWTDR